MTSQNTKIGWCDVTWNVTLGCSRVSAGCRSCYAIPTAHRMGGNPNPKISDVYRGLTTVRENGSVDWTGTVRLIPERLGDPYKWRKPRRVFVNSMSDLFHESLSYRDIGRVFDVMHHQVQIPRLFDEERNPHTWLILTKRPERMREFVADFVRGDAPNIWWGVSVENFSSALERIPILADTPVAHRWLSVEPLLGAVALPLSGISWVVVGGESGKGYRDMKLEWLESVVAQCDAANVPVFVKQDSAYRSETQGRIPDALWARKELP